MQWILCALFFILIFCTITPLADAYVMLSGLIFKIILTMNLWICWTVNSDLCKNVLIWLSNFHITIIQYIYRYLLLANFPIKLFGMNILFIILFANFDRKVNLEIHTAFNPSTASVTQFFFLRMESRLAMVQKYTTHLRFNTSFQSIF